MKDTKNSILPLYILLVLLTGLFGYILQNFIPSEGLWIDHYENMKLKKGEIQSLIIFQDKWSWITFLLIPLVYLVKLTALTMWILCGVIIFGRNVSFSLLFRKILEIEFIWLVPQLLSIIWFGFIESLLSINQIESFGYFSVVDLVTSDYLDTWMMHPLKSINLIQVLYLLLLANEIRKILDIDYSRSLKFTIPTYGSALFIWVIFYAFISLNQ